MFKTIKHLATIQRRVTDYFKIVILIAAFLVCASPLSTLIFGPQNTHAQSRADPRIEQQREDIKELKEQQKSQASDYIALEKRMIAMEVEMNLLSKGIWGSVCSAGTLIIIKILELIFVRRKEDNNVPNI